MLVEARDALRAVLHLDLAVNDQWAASNIDIIASTPGHVLSRNPCSIDAKVQLESGLLETFEGILFHSTDSVCEVDG